MRLYAVLCVAAIALLIVAAAPCTAAPAHPCPCCAVDEARISQILEQMTLEQKVAQLYMVGVNMLPGSRHKARRLVRDLGVGGVFLPPISSVAFSPRRTASNVRKLQLWALERDNPIPLLIAVDQEGGIPQALNDITGGTDTPGNMGLGATFDAGATLQAYDLMGQQLYALGINVNFAPVIEPDAGPSEPSMYTRCFSASTRAVAAHGAQAVRGLQANRVIACVKHFPGHANAPGDEHFGPVVNGENRETIFSRYLPPFDAAISNGAEMVMLTHATYRGLGNLPASIDPTVIELLRVELGFEGVIITDDINMGAIIAADWNELPDLAMLRAGVDIILDSAADSRPNLTRSSASYARWPHKVEEQIAAVARAVRAGRIDEGRIDRSVRRVLRLKMKYCLLDEPYRDPKQVERGLDTAEQRLLAQQLHSRALTVVRDEAELLPLDLQTQARVHVVCIGRAPQQMYAGAAWPNLSGTTLLAQVQAIDRQATGDTFPLNPHQRRIEQIVERAQAATPQVLLIGSYDAYYHPQQAELVRRLLALKLPTLIVALATPYDLLAFPEATTYLATYSNRDIAVQIAVRAIFGKAAAQGRLPVALPGLYPAGWQYQPQPKSDE
ncbi:MAG: glycoside hydrolase family 3 N-terminal domain-containing protein [Candidatus Alcyoniella australis]|nr:glycoside hydrolase family 3 N-terminal domain-containing protein [Candidatus Alcyoniella australis]